MRLLATKKLSLSLKDRLVQHGFSLIEHSFIQIKNRYSPNQITFQNHLNFYKSKCSKNCLFKSRNKISIGRKKILLCRRKDKITFRRKWSKSDQNAQNSAELAHFLVKNFKNEAFSFFCGNEEDPKLNFFLKT